MIRGVLETRRGVGRHFCLADDGVGLLPRIARLGEGNLDHEGAGWITSTSSGGISLDLKLSVRMLDVSDMAAAHLWIASANTGSRPASSLPIPSHCEPWPGNTKATRRRRFVRRRPASTPRGLSPSRKAASLDAISPRLPATAASRKSLRRKTPGRG
jgi:hypothetical protein